MSDTPSTPAVGSIGWIDLTVPNAVELRDFYSAVVGWAPTPLEMDGYSDFLMQAPGTGAPQAGVCHARAGQNAAIPPVWLVYVITRGSRRESRSVHRAAGPFSRVREAPAAARASRSFAIRRAQCWRCISRRTPARRKRSSG